MRVHACAYSLTTEQTCSLARQHASHHGVVVVAIVAVAICEMGERTKGVEKGERKKMPSASNQPTLAITTFISSKNTKCIASHTLKQSRLVYCYDINEYYWKFR